MSHRAIDMMGNKHLLQFLGTLYDAPRAMGIEEFARTNKEFTARSLYRWQAELSEDLLFYPSVAFRALGLTTVHLFIDDPSPVWQEFPYAIRGEWVVRHPGQHTLYLHCLVPVVHELQLAALVRDAEGTTASRVMSRESRDGWQVLRDFGSSPLSRVPNVSSDQHVWDIVERLPLLIAVIFESVEHGQSLPALWDAIYGRLGKRTWEYLPRFARRLPTNGKAYVKECFALLNHTGLFRQNIIRYRPLNAVGTPMFLHVDGELSAIINAFGAHAPSIDVFPITNDVALLRVVSTHALTQHIFSTVPNLPRITLALHRHPTQRARAGPTTLRLRTPLRPRHHRMGLPHRTAPTISRWTMTEQKELGAAAMTAALHGEKTAVLELQHAMIGEEIKLREEIKARNLAGIKSDEAVIREELQQLTPAHEGAADDPNARKERHVLERTETELHREERAEERAAWTDEQPLTQEDREIHKITLEQEQRRKRIDELM